MQGYPGVPHSVLPNVFISDWEDRIQSVLAKSADHSTLWRTARTLKNKITIKKNVNKLEKWFGNIQTKKSVTQYGKERVTLFLGRKSQLQKYSVARVLSELYIWKSNLFHTYNWGVGGYQGCGLCTPSALHSFFSLGTPPSSHLDERKDWFEIRD